jgi:hypothetical protein
VRIYSIDQLRQTAPEELRGLSDDELVFEYSKRKKLPYEDVANKLSLKPRSTLGQIGTQAKRSFEVEVPRTIGQATQRNVDPERNADWYAAEQGIEQMLPESRRGAIAARQQQEQEAARRRGQSMEYAAREAEAGYLPPDLRDKNWLQESLIKGAGGLGPAVTTIGLGVVSPRLGAMGAYELFGKSSALETKRRLIDEGMDPADAEAAAQQVERIQGGGEAAMNFLAGRALSPFASRLGLGATTTARTAAQMADTGIVKPFAKAYLTNLIGETVTEPIQDVGTALVEEAYGGKKQDKLAIAKESAQAAFGMAALLGLPSFGSHVVRARQAEEIKAALSDDPNIAPERRAEILQNIAQVARGNNIGEADISQWLQSQVDMADRQNTLLGQLEDSYRQQRTQDFEAAFNAPSGQQGQVRDANGKLVDRELSMGELLQQQADRISSGVPKDLLDSKPKTASEFIAELRQRANDPSQPSVWQFPVSTGLGDSRRGLFAQGPAAVNAPMSGPQDLLDPGKAAPVLGSQQRVAMMGPQGGMEPRPAFGGLTESQALAAGGPPALTSAQLPVNTNLSPPLVEGRSPQPSARNDAMAVSPSAPAAPGAFSTAAPAKKPAPKKPSAPRTKISESLADELDVVNDAADASLAQAIADRVNKEDLGAEVQGAKSIKFAGRMKLGQPQLVAIRNALLKKNGKTGEAKTQRIADAARSLAEAYGEYMGAATAASRAPKTAAKAPSKATMTSALRRGDVATEELRGLANAVSNALYELGQSTDNNAKDVEAVIRFVKNSVQRRLIKPGKTGANTLGAMRSIDAMLSSAWTAAKRGTFMGAEVDTADVSGQVVRPSEEQQEAGNLVSALEDAAKNGYKSPKGGKNPYKGIQGVLQYLSFNTTPMGKALSIALQDALDQSDNAPKISFVDKTGSRYDPKTNTIYINRAEQSAEVVLHETLHAALQWFVSRNPKHPAVGVLQRALDRALEAKGLEGKAKEVQDVLQKLVDKKRGLDAVLELVSYNATLNEFRKAMQQLPSTGETAGFRSSLNMVWNSLKRLVTTLVGGKPSLASDILDASMQLLEESTKETAPKKGEGAGKVLEAAVQSGKQKVEPGTTMPASPEAAASGQNIMMSKEQLSKYTKTLLPRFTLTETLFNQLGWQDWMKYADKKWVTPFNKFIQKETPKLAQAVSWFNSHYGLESSTVEMLVGMKDARRGGTAVSEKVAKYIADLPVEKSKALLSYMNDRLDYLRGLSKEPAFEGDTYMKRLADQAIDNWWKYATEGAMSAKDRSVFAGTKVGNRWVGGLKFTEGFVFPESVNQIASGSFGSRNMRELKSRRVKDEVGVDNIRFRTNSDGDAIIDDKFVGIYNDTPQLRARLQSGESLANIMPDEFISADLFVSGTPLDDKGQAMLHDPAFTWDLQKKGKNGFRFSAHYDAREAYSVKKALDVANAFQNTMTLLANSYASNTFAKGLYEIGTAKIGKNVVRDGSAVVFDDVDQLNEALNGEGEGASFTPQKDRKKWSYEIKPDKIIRISATESRSERIKNTFRNRSQWVLVPKGKGGEVYGALSGKIVSGSVWAAIQDAGSSQPVVNAPYFNDIMRFFKSVKTKYLPSTWATNVATNVMFAIADDIPLSTLPHAARLYAAATMSAEARKKAGLTLTPAEEELMVKILNSNALLGTFASDEIKKSVYESLLSNLDGPERNIASRMAQLAGVDKSRIEAAEKFVSAAKDKVVAGDNFMTEWYAAQDNIFRVASVLNYLGKAADAGKSIDEAMVYRAGKHAREAFLDYDIDSKAIRIMRQTAFPFISFPYAATKLVGKLAVHAPWKLVNIYAAAMVADAMLAAMADDDDEETRRTGPERFRERLLGGFGPHAYFRSPFMGDSENPVYYHAGKYLFASSLLDTSPNGFMGISWWPSAITPGGPFVSGILATVAGVDPFDGKSISDATATDFEKVVDRTKFLQSMMTPNLPFVNAKETEKFIDIASGRTDLPANSGSLAMARYLGLRVYNYNVDAELDAQDRAVKAIESEYKRAINKIKRKTERMEDPDWDEFYAKEEELINRMEKRIAERRGEEYEEE